MALTEKQIAEYKETLSLYVPKNTVESLYLFLARTNVVVLNITKVRKTKLGDYRCPHVTHPYHEISINGDLNPYFFLWVLLHEMAHLNTWLQFHNDVQPHGPQWQDNYRKLIDQYNTLGAFPADAGKLMARYTRRLPLSHPLGKQIETLLTHYNPDYVPDEYITLNDLPIGSLFRLVKKPEMLLESLEKRRTRYKCRNVHSGEMYLVDGVGQVKIAKSKE